MDMKEEALKLADSYDERARFKLEDHEKSGKLRMSTTDQSTIKRHKKTSDIIRRLVEELDEKNYRILELTKRYKALDRNNEQGEPEIVNPNWKCKDGNCDCPTYELCHPSQTKQSEWGDSVVSKKEYQQAQLEARSYLLGYLDGKEGVEAKVRGEK
jgi:hypothetical protein